MDTTSMLAKRSVAKPEVFVQVSSVGYYPNTFTGKVMDEEGEQGDDWLGWWSTLSRTPRWRASSTPCLPTPFPTRSLSML